MQKPAMRLIIVITLISIVFSSVVGAKDYFMFDFENDKILFLGSNEKAFSEKLNMEKNPHLIMQTYDPNLFLCVSKPDTENKKVAQLTLFNIESGRTEDLIDLGYFRVCWEYTEDRKNFFIAYQTTPDGGSYDLLHYYIPEQKTDILKNICQDDPDLYLSDDDQKLFLVRPRELRTFTYSPLKSVSSLKIRENPDRFYVLGDGQVALLDQNTKNSNSYPFLQYVDTKNNTLKEYPINVTSVSPYWFKEEKILILGARKISYYNNAFQGNGEFFKVTKDGVTNNKTSVWFDFEYLPQQDVLAVMGEYSIRLIDYKTKKEKTVSVNNNYFLDQGERKIYLYDLLRVPDTDLLTISCFKQRNVKFFSVDQKKLLKQVTTGKFKLFRSGGDAKPMITVNPQMDTYYILSRSTDDISVINKEFKLANYIAISEPCLNMYQIRKPQIQTIVTTEKKIYKLDYETCNLIPIYEFKETAKETALITDENNENRVLLLSDREIVVIDSTTLEVTNSFQFYGNPDEEYTKVKKGEQRYYFIRTL